MKKRKYIQPEMDMAEIAMSELMIPSSPGGEYNPAPQRAPRRKWLF